MIKKLLVLLLGLFLLGQSHAAIADDNPYGLPAEWLSCKTANDCGKDTNICGYNIVAANKDHVLDADAYICKGGKENPEVCSRGCAQLKPMGKDLREAFCDNGRCVLRLADSFKSLPPKTMNNQ